MKLVCFDFRENYQPLQLKFPDASDYDQFITKVKYIIAKWKHQERRMFIQNGFSLAPINDAIRLPQVSNEWLKCD